MADGVCCTCQSMHKAEYDSRLRMFVMLYHEAFGMPCKGAGTKPQWVDRNTAYDGPMGVFSDMDDEYDTECEV